MVHVANFRSQYDEHKSFFAHPGSTERVVYKSQYDDDGVLQIIPDGKENLTDFIQSHKDSCDINVLMKRYKNGEIQDLERVRGIYGDFTKAPKTYSEMLNIVLSGQELFEKLPLEQRANFGHDFGRFIASYDSPIFYESLRSAGLLDAVSQQPTAVTQPSVDVQPVKGDVPLES